MENRASQLMVIDAARISSIVEEALEKLSFLASITPDVMAHREELSQIVGDEITRIISEQRALETQYEQLVAQRNSLKSAQSNKMKFTENQDAIREVARALRESTKELTRNLKGNPNIAENLSKIQAERTSLQSLLSKTLRELRESSFSTLTTTVDEEKLRNDMLLEVIANEQKVSASVKSLQGQLSSSRHTHETDVEERRTSIDKLREELQDLRTEMSIRTQYLHNEFRARGESSTRVFAKDERKLRDEILKLSTQLQIEKRVNGESEDFLRRKWSKLQIEIESWSMRFETDLEKCEQDLDKLTNERAGALVRLTSLKESYDKDVEEKRKKDEDARALFEAERTKAIEDERGNRAATKIQAFWRGWLQRNAGKVKKGKKGKGTKGAKGKGKGAKGKKKRNSRVGPGAAIPSARERGDKGAYHRRMAARA
eukprot:CAMPEP_0179937600 /NCGR_PEP_ID=MMETSP0983-20121128/14421_1 /TAXON_ID=483367 /ORGANISM="non described non described, Strain CCMP 2436" /LENGTH=429 /DNA_ID=CAMNT_0021843349 /DNA_START=15 /DNA_END=1305 /DNA_ORIENTATION=-